MHKTTLSCYINIFLCSLTLLTTTNIVFSFTVVPLAQILKQHPEIGYTPCFGNVSFNYKHFEIAPLYPHKGYFKECFILNIPQGKVQSQFGFVLIEDQCIEELIWADQPHLLSNIISIHPNTIQHIPGRVVVLAQYVYNSYSHFLNEILGRLALLEMHNIQYDWIYLDVCTDFMKETLELWGIDTRKIIMPKHLNACIQADELIVPSMVINTSFGFKKHIGLFTHPYTSEYVRQKLLQAAIKHAPTIHMSKKIFISREDAPSRKIKNEAEIFELLQPLGFEKYIPGKLSVVDQILLFNNADIVIAEHGTALVNILFCKSHVHIIEIFQLLVDASFWYISEMLNFKYTPIKTHNFIDEYMYDWSKDNASKYLYALRNCSEVPLDPIIDIIKTI